ncbi:MAG: ATP-binding cassette domain-containing protein [Peptococcaceae bacterium]|jgi:ABC-2 type transport system ATP-binding protein|nr:ATP-binding cassette domain-containing protein [Peptococcaceae bacterium]
MGFGFIGPNGAGKTTTIKLILNIINGDSGSVTLFGSRETPDVQIGQIGVVMDAPLYVDEWTVGDMEASVSPFYPNWNEKAFADYVRKFGLDVKKKVKELSRGMKVKLQIAAALSHDAKLLILDEPADKRA